MSSTNRHQLRVLGAVELVGPDAPELTRTESQVLALLALHAGEIVPSEMLCDVLWPGIPIDKARARLRTQAWRLRNNGALDHLAASVRGTRRGWMISGAFTSDAGHFTGAATEALASGSRTLDERRTMLERAYGLWGGPPLPSLAGREQVPAIAALDELHDRLVLEAARAELAGPGAVRVLDDLRPLVNGRDGQTWSLLAAAQIRDGRPAEALQTIDAARQALQAEGTPIPGELDEIEQRVLAGARGPSRVADLLRADAAEPSELVLRPSVVAAVRSDWHELSPATVRLHALVGPAGSGATQVLEHVARAVGADGGVVAAIDPTSATGWVHVHRAPGPGPDVDDEPADLHHLLLQCGGRLLVIADRHVDNATFATRLRQLCDSSDRLSALVVRVLSSPVTDAALAINGLRRLVGAPNVSVTKLVPLTDDRVRELIAHLDAGSDGVPRRTSDRDWIVQQAGGNPGLATALADSGAGPFTPIPEAAIAHAERRLVSVPASALRSLALAGTRDGQVLLARLLSGSPDAIAVLRILDALEADGIVVDDEDGPRFVSPLFAELTQLLAG